MYTDTIIIEPDDMETCYRLKKNTCIIIHCFILECNWPFRHYIRVQQLCHSNVIFKN